MRILDPHDILRAGHNDVTAQVATFRAKIDNAVSGLDDVQNRQ